MEGLKYGVGSAVHLEFGHQGYWCLAGKEGNYLYFHESTTEITKEVAFTWKVY